MAGAQDGWLCCTDAPFDVDNIGDYFSGHYQRYGLNIQAICDANLRFIFVAIAAPGRTNDARAFCRLTGLRRWLATVPNEFFLHGDNAYVLDNNFLIPFSGARKSPPFNDSYNFFHSQLRIRIELAFGLLSTKWRIFRRNLTFSSAKNANIIMAAFKLHNFVINVEKLDYGNHLDRTSLGILPFPVTNKNDRDGVNI